MNNRKRHADRVAVEIHNQGTIPSDLLPRIFEPFRSGRHYTSRGAGLGLGLFIAKTMLERSGASIVTRNLEAPETGARIIIRWLRASFERGGLVRSVDAASK